MAPLKAPSGLINDPTQPEAIQSHSPRPRPLMQVLALHPTPGSSLRLPSLTNSSPLVRSNMRTIFPNHLPNDDPSSFISPSATPFRARISSYDGQHKTELPSKINCREMGAVLLKELHSDSILSHHTLDLSLFPSSGFKFSNQFSDFNDDLLASMDKVWDHTLNGWRLEFPSSRAEKHVAHWLNAIGDDFRRVTGIPILRRWFADHCNSAPPGSDTQNDLGCKPDVILTNAPANVSSSSQHVTWNHVHSFAEVTKRPDFHSVMKQTVYTKSHVLFSVQHSRRFIPSVAIHGMSFRLTLIDREGVIYTTISLKGGTSNALSIIRIIAGFMCGDLAALGYDPTIALKPDGSVDTITVTSDLGNATIYHVLETLHVASGITGRCTRVWHARGLAEPKAEVVIKDTWPVIARENLEERMLARLQGIPGIPTVTVIVTVSITLHGSAPFPDSTYLHRKAISSTCHNRNRIHRRLVMSTVGVQLQNFRKLSELIGAFRDVIIAHGDAIRRGVLHRDISINNIMLYESGSGERKGMLIDFDHASFQEFVENVKKDDDVIQVDDEHMNTDAGWQQVNSPEMIQASVPAPGDNHKDAERTGTPPFIANAILLRRESHAGKHDLESMFYSLIYALMILKGPEKMRQSRHFQVLSSIPVFQWFDRQVMNPSFKDIARLRMGHLADFEGSIVAKIDLYFGPLFPFLRRLLTEFFPGRDYLNNRMTHARMIELFNEAYEELKDQEARESALKQSGKRRRVD